MRVRMIWCGMVVTTRGQKTAAGLYYYRLETKDFTGTRPVVRLK